MAMIFGHIVSMNLKVSFCPLLLLCSLFCISFSELKCIYLPNVFVFIIILVLIFTYGSVSCIPLLIPRPKIDYILLLNIINVGLNKDFVKMLSDRAEFRALVVKDIVTASDGTRKVDIMFPS